MIKKQKEKIFKFIDKKKNGCWIWKGSCYASGLPRIFIKDMRHPVRKWLFGLDTKKAVHPSCNNQKCVNPAHATHSLRPGELNSNCKLSVKKVLKIREEYFDGMTAKELAKKYKVHYGYIYHVAHKKYWANI